MFNSGILDVVIGMVVIYLQLSLVCTAFNELIASWFKKRAKELEKGIGALLTDPQLVDKFYAHPLITGLRPDGRKPSYIPSRTFALALMDIVRRHSYDGTLTAAGQAVVDKTEARDKAQAVFNDATTERDSAQRELRIADEAAAAAGAADKLTATRAAEDSARRQTKAGGSLTEAASKLKAVEQALTDATSYQKKVEADTLAATQAETEAQTAEANAKAKPKDEKLQQEAATARQKANAAADSVAPSAASLLTEARDKVAGAQANVVPPELKTALLALMDNAGTNLIKAQANLEQWFDDAMDRVSGVYKRKSQVWVVVIAVLVTVFANVDSLQVADSLSQDKALRESLVAAAPELARKDKDLVDKERGATPTPTPTSPPAKPPAGETGSAKNGANSNTSTTPTPTPSPTPAQTPSLGNIKASLDEIRKLGVPVGYIRVCTPSEEKLVKNNCPNKVDAALIDAEATLSRAQDDLDKAKAAIKKTGGDGSALQAAQKLASAQVDAAKVARDQAIKAADTSKQQEAEATLKKAQDDLEDANEALKKTDGEQTTVAAVQKLALAQVSAAKVARDQAIKAAATAKQVEAEAVSDEASGQSDEALAKAARADAQANSQDNAKQAAAATAEKNAKASRQKADAAQRIADDQRERLRNECEKCRKESELSANELKQRLPTTHGYRILGGAFRPVLSEDYRTAFAALAGDIWGLLYSHWLGWLLTALAISLGAPFWFDTLNRLMVIRSTVKPHEKSKEQESKDNPDDKDGTKKS